MMQMNTLKGPDSAGKGDRKYNLTLRQIVNRVASGLITPNENNRGGVGLSMYRVKDIAENFDILSFGQIKVADFGTFNKMADAHHRVAALLKAPEFDSIPDEVWDMTVSVSVIHETDFIKAYQNLNLSKSHAGKEKITNPDLAIGKVYSQILNQAGVQIPPEKAQTLLDVALAYERKGTRLDFADVYEARRTIDKQSKLVEVTSVKFSRETIQMLSYALRSYVAVVNLTQDKTKKYGLLTKKSVKQSGFLLMFLMGYCTRNWSDFAHRSTAKIAARIEKDPARLHELLGTIGRRHSNRVDDAGIARYWRKQ